MIVITIYFLTGMYCATPWGSNVNEGVPEWPPSVWRLLRAIIAVWKNTKPELEERDLWPILQKLAGELPHYNLPNAGISHTRHYMPTTCDKPTLVVNTFVVTRNKPVDIIWKNTELDSKELEILQAILKNMHYFGRAESWCNVIASTGHQKKYNCSPRQDHKTSLEDMKELVRVLMPKKDMSFVDHSMPNAENNDDLKSISVTTMQLQNKKYIDPPGGRWVQYVRSRNCFEEKVTLHKSSSLPTDITLVRYAVVGTIRPLIKDTLRIGDIARSACMSKYGQRRNGENSHTFSGKDGNGKPLQNHKHAFYLPTYETQNMEIDHITIFAHGKFNEDELKVLLMDLKRLYHHGETFADLVFQGRGKLDDFRESIPILKKSKRWKSSTPLILSRHIKYVGKKGSKRIMDGPEDQIRNEIKKRYGDDYKITSIHISEDSKTRMNSTAFRPMDFFRWRRHGSVGDRKTYNVTLEFQEEVSGPIVLGYASHFGLGMFVPDICVGD